MNDYWGTAITGMIGLAGSGLLGHKIQGIVAPNPPTAISRPASAPPSAPVPGQQGATPATGVPLPGISGHFSRNWKKYLVGVATVVGLIVAVKVIRK